LSWNQGPVAAGYYLGILLLNIIVFFVVKGACALRDHFKKDKTYSFDSALEMNQYSNDSSDQKDTK